MYYNYSSICIIIIVWVQPLPFINSRGIPEVSWPAKNEIDSS